MRTKALKRTLTRIHNYLTIHALQVYRGGGGGGGKSPTTQPNNKKNNGNIIYKIFNRGGGGGGGGGGGCGVNNVKTEAPTHA